MRRLMRKAFATALLLINLAAVAQSPEVMCPVHHVPAQLTGKTKTDGEGRTVAYEYCHTQGYGQHCFWAHN